MKRESFSGRQRTEAKMIREFKAKFGSGEEAIVAIGDWEQWQHRKFCEPTKGKGFRTLLRKAGYEVYLVDEFCTTTRCSDCEAHGWCTTFRGSARTQDRTVRDASCVMGLIRCQNCQRLWNRYERGQQHMEGSRQRKGLPRRAYLQRPKTHQSGELPRFDQAL